MEHAHAAVAMMALAAALASAAAAHVHEGVGGAAEAGRSAQALHSHVGVSGGGPAVATLHVANAGRVALVSANATACGASGLLGRAAGDAGWSLRPGAAASVSWAAPCAGGEAVLVRVEYEMEDGAEAASFHRACPGGGGSPACWGGGGGGGGGTGGPARPGSPAPAPAPAPPAPAIASCAVDGLTVTVCANGSSAGGAPAAYEVLRLLAPGPAEYAPAGSLAPPAGGAACHADAAPRNSARATYVLSAGAGERRQESLPARADFAAQQCYVSTPSGERIGSPGGPPAPPPAAPSDYRIAMYAGLGSTPLTVEARFGPDRLVVERQGDGSWSRLGYLPSHPSDSLSEYLPVDRVARGASGEADVRYVRADLLRHLDAFWGARQ